MQNVAQNQSIINVCVRGTGILVAQVGSPDTGVRLDQLGGRDQDFRLHHDEQRFLIPGFFDKVVVEKESVGWGFERADHSDFVTS